MELSSWGNHPKIQTNNYVFNNVVKLQDILAESGVFIPRGNGRSYGDSALNDQLISVKQYNYFLGFDSQNGILHCQAGVLLSEILDAFVERGWFLTVTPGTKLITLGGAIASDVHGKNHHVAGSFSDCVVEFLLMLPDGSVCVCSAHENKQLFHATCGGMGLTGVILEVKIKLQPITSSAINQLTIKTKNLRETFEAFEKYKNYTYSVAWIDCLARGSKLGRCLLMVGEHATNGSLIYENSKNISIPFEFPSFALNSLSVKAFNTLFYGKARSGVVEDQVGIDSFFYPLDAIDHWNRIYGSCGFTQYQFVLPIEKSYEGLEEILRKIAESGKGSFLAVLKLFGKGNENYLSFAKIGYTLALDFKVEPGLFELLDELDQIVLKYEGRFYLTKDVRVQRETFECGYEQIDIFRQLRNEYEMDKKFHSIQSKRVGI